MSQGDGAERRQLKRMRVGFPIRLVGDLMNKKGVVVDLSLGGCGIERQEGLKDAKYLGLMLCPPGSEDPIKVELAAVRWVGDQQAVGVDLVHHVVFSMDTIDPGSPSPVRRRPDSPQKSIRPDRLRRRRCRA